MTGITTLRNNWLETYSFLLHIQLRDPLLEKYMRGANPS